ncbi:Proteasome subunit beta type-7 [Phlyctochytrium planicorne]|nr:Proteasome subunit beta type-7 [Phlyctochytrium planicorne]
MDYYPGNWGNPRTRDDGLFSSHDYFPGTHAADRPKDHHALGYAGAMEPVTRTQQPVVTGTSVIAIKYKDGVMLAADNLASYGSLARFRDVERLLKVGDYTVVGASGDISDFQYLKHTLEGLLIDESYGDDGHKLGPKNIHEYLSNVMYNRRSKHNPIWNSLVIAGLRDGEHFLGYVDLQGTTYHSESIATGYGAYIAQPLLRKAIDLAGGYQNITEADAVKLIDDCMRVLYYRDARSLDKIQRATVNGSGVSITEPYKLATEWGFAERIRGYGAFVA